MVNIETERKWSTRELIVYQIFKENYYRALNIKTIMELINKKDEKISKRTVYRIIRRLMDMNKIYCSDISKGMRSFEVVKKYYCMMICEECNNVNCIEIPKEYRIEKLYSKDRCFSIVGGYIKINGLCKKCIEKIIDND